MRKLLAVHTLAALLFGGVASATTTYSVISLQSTKAVCTSGSEADPSGVGTATAPVGVDLKRIAKVAVRVCADSGQTITGGSSVALWYYDGTGTEALWGLYDLGTLKTGKRCSWVSTSSPAVWIPTPSRGRFTAVLSGVTFSSGGGTVSMYTMDLDGAAR